eukprot:11366468-Ditylum_brightwellii.AAC.1
MDKLTATRCCSELPFLNTTERAMSLLNIGLSVLSLTIDPNADNWLLEYVINGMILMKMVMENIDDYNNTYAKEIKILKHCIRKTSTTASKDEEDAPEEENINISSKVVTM